MMDTRTQLGVEDKKKSNALVKFFKNFSNLNVTNYILAYILLGVTSVVILVLYQYYVNAIPPPNEFLNDVFKIIILELLGMVAIAVADNLRGSGKEVETYE